MTNGVHYCPTTSLYQVWIDGRVVAGSNEAGEANDIYIARLRRNRLREFRATEQWMVAAYGD
jgi:hypothetical protein